MALNGFLVLGLMMLKWPLKGVAFVTGEGPERAADDGEAADCSDKGRE
jgi:hypothetical protein